MRIIIEKSEYGNQSVCHDCGYAIKPMEKYFLCLFDGVDDGFHMCKRCMADFMEDIEMLISIREKRKYR